MLLLQSKLKNNKKSKGYCPWDSTAHIPNVVILVGSSCCSKVTPYRPILPHCDMPMRNVLILMPQAFFRRAVQSGKDKVYRCKRSGDCQVIQKLCLILYLKTHTAGQSQPSHGIILFKLFFQVSVASRRSCQKCRFLKCIAVGMTAAWVLSEEQCTIRSQNSDPRI